MPAIDGLQIISFNGEDYIGRIRENEGHVEVFDASPIGKSPKRSWLKNNLCKTLEKHVLSATTPYTLKDFNEEELLEFAELERKLEHSKAHALDNLICQDFDNR